MNSMLFEDETGSVNFTLQQQQKTTIITTTTTEQEQKENKFLQLVPLTNIRNPTLSVYFRETSLARMNHDRSSLQQQQLKLVI